MEAKLPLVGDSNPIWHVVLKARYWNESLIYTGDRLGVLKSLASACHHRLAEPPSINIDLEKVLRSEGAVTFITVDKTSSLPVSIVSEFGGLAEPGADYRETDVGDGRLPNHRLIVAGISDQYCLLHYEVGGIGKYFVIAIFQKSGSGTKAVWATYAGRSMSLMEIKTALESGKMRNELPKLFL